MKEIIEPLKEIHRVKQLKIPINKFVRLNIGKKLREYKAKQGKTLRVTEPSNQIEAQRPRRRSFHERPNEQLKERRTEEFKSKSQSPFREGRLRGGYLNDE